MLVVATHGRYLSLLQMRMIASPRAKRGRVLSGPGLVGGPHWRVDLRVQRLAVVMKLEHHRRRAGPEGAHRDACGLTRHELGDEALGHAVPAVARNRGHHPEAVALLLVVDRRGVLRKGERAGLERCQLLAARRRHRQAHHDGGEEESPGRCLHA
jgi:hypothetical protein